MAFAPCPNTVMVQIRYGAFSQLVINSFYFEKVGGWSEANIDQLVGAVDLAVTNHLAPINLDAVNFSEMYIRDLSQQFGIIRTAAFTTTNGGIVGQTPLPINCSLAVKFATGMAGRGRQGRVFWPLLAQNEINNNFVVGVKTTAIIDGYTNFLQAITTSVGIESTHVVVHSKENGVPLNPRTTTPVVDVLLTDSVIDSQRRRLPGRGA